MKFKVIAILGLAIMLLIGNGCQGAMGPPGPPSEVERKEFIVTGLECNLRDIDILAYDVKIYDDYFEPGNWYVVYQLIGDELYVELSQFYMGQHIEWYYRFIIGNGFLSFVSYGDMTGKTIIVFRSDGELDARMVSMYHL